MRFVAWVLPFILCLSYAGVSVAGVACSKSNATDITIKKFENLDYTPLGGSYEEVAKAAKWIASIGIRNPLKPTLIRNAPPWASDATFDYYFVDEVNCNLVVAVKKNISVLFANGWNVYINKTVKNRSERDNFILDLMSFYNIQHFDVDVNVYNPKISKAEGEQCRSFLGQVDLGSLVRPYLLDKKLISSLKLDNKKTHYVLAEANDGFIVSIDKKNIIPFQRCWDHYVIHLKTSGKIDEQRLQSLDLFTLR